MKITRRNFLGMTLAAGATIAAANNNVFAQSMRPFRSAGSSEDIYSVLKADHKEVSKLIVQMQKGSGNLADTFAKFRQALLPHAKAEEATFYPAVEQADKKAILKATVEHHAVENLIKEMQGQPSNDEKWQAKLAVLKDMIDHHVKEEEGQVFSKAKKVLKGDQPKQMAASFQQKKQELISSI